MQSGKNATASAKEKVENLGASAKAGLEKTKATLQEKAEKLTSRDPVEKQMAEQKKEGKQREAELRKQEVHEQNYIEKEGRRVAGSHTTAGGGLTNPPPSYGSEHVESGVLGSHPLGTGTATDRTSTAHNPRTHGTIRSDYGTGGGYNN